MQEHTDRKAARDGIDYLYGTEQGPNIFARLAHMLDDFGAHKLASTAENGSLSERDSILITYGDMVSEPDISPLVTLRDFLITHLNGIVSTVHLLPFFPYSSDDGFSVIDYREVDSQLGTWDDIRQLRQHFRLMFDGVINHISAQSKWFQDFLRGDLTYQDWFIIIDDAPDLSQVTRPRALPLLTSFNTPTGDKAVWTTFSADQIDLNYCNPNVLLEVIDTLLFYVSQGADLIRLDAVAYLWKEIGTTCIHLPQTHRIIQLMRDVLSEVAPYVKLITETNVPHPDNVSYLGDGHNEAHLVYNFALPPLILHTLRTGNARPMSDWAAGLSLPSDQVCFFNFIASHDGIGLNPARGILKDGDIDALVDQTIAHGGHVSYKHNSDGSQSPYELNINYFDALSNPVGREPIEVGVDRFMVAQAIMLALAGLPGIYFHSLFGSRGWPEGMALTGQKRTINRRKLDRVDLERELNDRGSLRSQVFQRIARLLRVRAASPAFHPQGEQTVLDCGESVFGMARTSPDGDHRVLCLHNVTDQEQPIHLTYKGSSFTDILTQQEWRETGSIKLDPYQTRWLRVEGKGHDTQG